MVEIVLQQYGPKADFGRCYRLTLIDFGLMPDFAECFQLIPVTGIDFCATYDNAAARGVETPIERTKPVRRVSGLLPALAMVTLLVVVLAGKAVAEDAVSLDAVLAKLAPPPSGEALTQIPDPGRKLLALRSYIRYGAKLPIAGVGPRSRSRRSRGRPSSRRCWPRSRPSTNTSRQLTQATRSMSTVQRAVSMNSSRAGTRTSPSGQGRRRSWLPTRRRSGKTGWSRQRSTLRGLMHGCAISSLRSGPTLPPRD